MARQLVAGLELVLGWKEYMLSPGMALMMLVTFGSQSFTKLRMKSLIFASVKVLKSSGREETAQLKASMIDAASSSYSGSQEDVVEVGSLSGR